MGVGCVMIDPAPASKQALIPSIIDPDHVQPLLSTTSIGLLHKPYRFRLLQVDKRGCLQQTSEEGEDLQELGLEVAMPVNDMMMLHLLSSLSPPSNHHLVLPSTGNITTTTASCYYYHDNNHHHHPTLYYQDVASRDFVPPIMAKAQDTLVPVEVSEWENLKGGSGPFNSIDRLDRLMEERKSGVKARGVRGGGVVVVVLCHCLPMGFEGFGSGSRGSGGVSSSSLMAIDPVLPLVSPIALHW